MQEPIKIISYNVNGIRSALKKGFYEWLQAENPEIICLQEIKAGVADVEWNMFKMLGYNVYLHPATKKGYSGLATLTKPKPLMVTNGLDMQVYDNEGRLMNLQYKEFSLINTYFPSGTTGDIRQDFKMKYLEDFSSFIENKKGEHPNMIICGDLNICHKPIDINHPERHKKSSGFLPEERAWFDSFVENGFVDTFRMFNQEPNQYSWWSYRAGARAKNLGWRIDYHLVSEPFKHKVIDAQILQDAVHSDHCPVVVQINTTI